jgi:hypothetical protein
MRVSKKGNKAVEQRAKPGKGYKTGHLAAKRFMRSISSSADSNVHLASHHRAREIANRGMRPAIDPGYPFSKFFKPGGTRDQPLCLTRGEVVALIYSQKVVNPVTDSVIFDHRVKVATSTISPQCRRRGTNSHDSVQTVVAVHIPPHSAETVGIPHKTLPWRFHSMDQRTITVAFLILTHLPDHVHMRDRIGTVVKNCRLIVGFCTSCAFVRSGDPTRPIFDPGTVLSLLSPFSIHSLLPTMTNKYCRTNSMSTDHIEISDHMSCVDVSQ